MIQVTMKKHKKSSVDVSVKGHALEAPYGHDIVCAAVSVLLEQLRIALMDVQYTDDGEAVNLHADLLDTGDLRLVSAFEAMMLRLAEQYPTNVSFDVVNTDGRQG